MDSSMLIHKPAEPPHPTSWERGTMPACTYEVHSRGPITRHCSKPTAKERKPEHPTADGSYTSRIPVWNTFVGPCQCTNASFSVNSGGLSGARRTAFYILPQGPPAPPRIEGLFLYNVPLLVPGWTARINSHLHVMDIDVSRWGLDSESINME